MVKMDFIKKKVNGMSVEELTKYTKASGALGSEKEGRTLADEMLVRVHNHNLKNVNVHPDDMVMMLKTNKKIELVH